MTEAEEMEELVWRRRYTKFVSEGCPENEAYELAVKMMFRDREEDPQCLRICFECTHLAVKYCSVIKDRFGRPSVQPRFTLQRCPSFKLKGKK